MDETTSIRRHRGLVLSQARQFKPTRVSDRGDFIQVGEMALLRALRTYDPKRGSFSVYARKIIRNAIIAEIRQFADECVLLNEDQDVGYETDTRITDDIPAMTERESMVFKLRRAGHTFKEISIKLGISQTTTRRVIQRIKKKANAAKEKDSTRQRGVLS